MLRSGNCPPPPVPSMFGLKVPPYRRVQQREERYRWKANHFIHGSRYFACLKSQGYQSISSKRAESQSLLCSESMLSSCPLSDEPQRSLSQHNVETQPWKRDPHNQKLPAKYTSNLSKDLSDGPGLPVGVSRGDSISSSPAENGNTCTNHTSEPKGGGNGGKLDRRMNTNGLDRNTMTGSGTTTSENLTWLADVSSSQAQQAQRASTGILPTIPSTHDTHLMLPQGGASSLFRPPLTLSDPSQRLFPGGPIAPVYTTTGTTLSPYSPSMYSPHAASQSSQLSISPYGAFYPSYPHGYTTHGSLLSGHYPHIESYSAVLASMGSQVQHAAQSQLPRAPFLSGHLPHYGTLTPTNSPGPNIHRPLTPSQTLTPSQQATQGPSVADPHHREEKSPKVERDMSRSGRPGSPQREGKVHQQPSPTANTSHHKTGHSVLKEGSRRDSSSCKEAAYRLPSGKEGSLKHRFLQTRPPDIVIEDSAYGDFQRYAAAAGHMMRHSSDEPLSKKPKESLGHPPPLHPSHRHLGSVSHAGSQGHPHLPPPPPLQPASYASQPHYPPHFMKGSIIQLANGELKRVEDLRTDDFVHSADISSDLKIDSSTVVRIDENLERATAMLGFSVGEHRIQVTVEATLEHPFFVFGQGWSSCQPERTLQRYGLVCHKLSVGDVCISLTHREANSRAAELSNQQQLDRANQITEISAASLQPPDGSDQQRQRLAAAHTASGGGSKEDTHKRLQQKSVTEAETRHASVAAGSAPSGGAGGVTTPRKRRWSAPDHISLDSGSLQSPAVTSSAISSNQGHLENSDHKR